MKREHSLRYHRPTRPRCSFDTVTIPRRINFWGDIIGYYIADGVVSGAFLYNPGQELYAGTTGYGPVDLGLMATNTSLVINDNLQIAGRRFDIATAFRWQIDLSADDLGFGEGYEELEGLDTDYRTVADMNNTDNGVVLGNTYDHPYKGNKAVFVCYRYDETPGFFPSGRGPGRARSINDNGDFITNNRIYFDPEVHGDESNLDAQFGYFWAHEVIDPNDPLADCIVLDSYSLYVLNTPPTLDGYGQIAGRLYDGPIHAFVLTPTE